jgi:hypothetical protein
MGLSIGYFLSLKFSDKFFYNSFLAIVFLHLTFPLSYRMLSVEIARLNLDGYMYVVLMFVYALIFSSIFAVFLSRLVHEKSSDKESAIQKTKVLYSMELIGFAAGFAIVGMSWNKGVEFILPIYGALLAVIIHLALQKKTWTVAFMLLAIVSSNFIVQVDRQTTVLIYEYKHRRIQV